jgi:hypothetical protein
VKSLGTGARYVETRERESSKMGAGAPRTANRARGRRGKRGRGPALGWFCEELVDILYKALPFLTLCARSDSIARMEIGVKAPRRGVAADVWCLRPGLLTPGRGTTFSPASAPPPHAWLCMTHIASWPRDGGWQRLWRPPHPLQERCDSDHGRALLRPPPADYAGLRSPLTRGRASFRPSCAHHWRAPDPQKAAAATPHLHPRSDTKGKRREARNSRGKGSAIAATDPTELCGVHSQAWGGGSPPSADVRGG